MFNKVSKIELAQYFDYIAIELKKQNIHEDLILILYRLQDIIKDI